MSNQQQAQDNVIPKGLQWTVEKYNKAVKDNTYVYVRSEQEIAQGEAHAATHDGKGIKKTVPRKLVNAPKVWNGNANYVVDTQFRICGDFGQVAKALYYAGQFESVDAALQYVQSSPTVLHSGNYQTSPLFLAETEKTKKDTTEKNTSRYRLEDIVLFADNIKSAQRPSEVVNNEGVVSPRTKRNKPVSLEGKINKARAEGKILDISKMKENGAESRSKPPLKDGSKSLLRNTTNFPFLYSNNVETFKTALRLLFGDAGLAQYAGDIAELEQKLATKVVPPVSAPSVVPVVPLQMAPNPVFTAK
jgi:hypothetical protein